MPLITLFVVRGLLMTFEVVEPSLRRLFRLAPRAPHKNAAMLSPAETVLFGLYIRIVVMQVTIILGAWFAMLIGTAGALVFLIANQDGGRSVVPDRRRALSRRLGRGKAEGRGEAAGLTSGRALHENRAAHLARGERPECYCERVRDVSSAAAARTARCACAARP